LTAVVTGTGEVEVTATAPSSPESNVDSTLRIACVENAGSPPDCPIAGDTAWVDVATSGAAQAVDVPTAGALYTCFAAEFSDTPADTYRVCAPGVDVRAALIPPTLTAVVPGTSAGEVEVTATAPSSPSNVDSTLRVACLASPVDQSDCPAAGDSAWRNATSSPQTIPDRTAGALYTCFAAEFSDTPADTYRVCAPGVDVTAALIPPTLTAVVPGTSPLTVEVTATAPSSPSNVDSTLRIACVENAGSPPNCPIAGDAAWMDVTTSGAAQAVDVPTAGALYTCFAAEFSDTPADTYRVCAPGVDVRAALIPPTLTAVVPGTSAGEVEVTATAPSSPSNVDSTLRVACLASPVDQSDCPAAGDSAWRNATSSPQTIPDRTAGALYTCFAAEFSDTPADTYRVCAPGVDVTAALIPPTLTAVVTGTSPGEVDVTATAPSSPSNVDSTLRVACLANPGIQPDCPAAGNSAWRDATSSPQTIPGLTAGALYSCYAAEFANSPTDTYRVCSTAVIDAVAALNAPTVTASTGTVGGAVLVTGLAPLRPSVNFDAALNVACVEASGAACPAFDAEGWVAVTNPGVAEQVSTLADGSSMVGGTAYTCYSAEISTHPSVNYGVCSEAGADVTAKTLNQPEVVTRVGNVLDQVSVTGTVPSPGNVGTVLKVACVTLGVDCPAFNATGWENVTDSGQPQQVSKLADGTMDLVGGDSYTCYSAEFVGNDRVCSTGSDVIASSGESNLVPSDSEADALFGYSVSLNAAGDVALVGAWGDDATGGVDSGAAYVFTYSYGSWTQTTKLVPSDSEVSAFFGSSVSLNAAGDVALVGAYWDDANSADSNSGAAYVFTYSDESWNQTTKLVPSDSEAFAKFGFSVSLNDAGNVALVGAYQDDANTAGSESGAAYVFTYSDSWNQTTKLVPSDSQAYASFGRSVSLNAAGDVALVGAQGDDANSLTLDSGAAYVFTYSESWNQTEKLVPSDSQAGAFFGNSVSLNAAGDVALVGAVSDDANSAGSYSGAAYVFAYSSGSWTETTKLIPSDSEAYAGFGVSVSLNSAGDVALVGAPGEDANSLTGSGAAYVFTYSSGLWAQTTKLVASDSEVGAYFGVSVSLNAVGDVALVGADGDDADSSTQSGAAYSFRGI
jgi:hypothetical protein